MKVPYRKVEVEFDKWRKKASNNRTVTGEVHSVHRIIVHIKNDKKQKVRTEKKPKLWKIDRGLYFQESVL